MSLQALWMLLGAVVGALIPVQTAVNNRMREAAGQPLFSSFINFAVGTLLLGVMLGCVPRLADGGSWRGATSAPWWAWTGGAFGAVFVTATVIIVQRTGQATLAAALFAGQMIGALLLDHYGWMGMATREVTPTRLLAVVLLAAGMWLMQK